MVDSVRLIPLTAEIKKKRAAGKSRHSDKLLYHNVGGTAKLVVSGVFSLSLPESNSGVQNIFKN